MSVSSTIRTRATRRLRSPAVHHAGDVPGRNDGVSRGQVVWALTLGHRRTGPAHPISAGAHRWPDAEASLGVPGEGTADRLGEVPPSGRRADDLGVAAEREGEAGRPLRARAGHLDDRAPPLEPLHEPDARARDGPARGRRADPDADGLALGVREQARASEIRLAGRLEAVVRDGTLADAVEPEREWPLAGEIEAVEVPVAEPLRERPWVDDTLGLRVARRGVVGDAHGAALGDRALQPAEDRVARGGRARVDPLDQLVEARAAVPGHRVAEGLDGPLAPLAAEGASGGGERGRLALGEAGRAREALVERDEDAFPLDVEVEEVVRRERRRADAEQEVEILEQLLLAAAAAPRRSCSRISTSCSASARRRSRRDPGVAHRVRHEEE